MRNLQCETRKFSVGLTLLLAAFALLTPARALFAIGTYSEGAAVVQIVKLEQSGIIFDSWEGQLKRATFDPAEDCSETDNQCYKPEAETLEFSVDVENKETADFIRRNVGREMLVRFRIHRIAPLSLDSDFEVVSAEAWAEAPPADLPPVQRIDRSGGKRSFSIYGRVLRLEYRGTVVGTWEGLYYDQERRKVHPFSLTDEAMAQHILRAMSSAKPYFIGVSVAYVAAVRDTNYDLFEINYNEAAGGE